MTRDEVVATLKNTFDLHYKGNRAPFFFGGHTPLYADGYDPSPPNATVPSGARPSKSSSPTCMVSYGEGLEWLRHPTAL